MSLIDKLEQFAPWVGGETEAIMNAAAAELRRLAAAEAELERIRALEPVAWREPFSLKHHNGEVTHGYQFRDSKCSLFDEPLYALKKDPT